MGFLGFSPDAPPARAEPAEEPPHRRRPEPRALRDLKSGLLPEVPSTLPRGVAPGLGPPVRPTAGVLSIAGTLHRPSYRGGDRVPRAPNAGPRHSL